MPERQDSAASRLAALFSGLKRAHGVYQITGTKGEKQTGTAATITEPVTNTLWQQHLDGSQGLGIIPITDESTCLFGAIDIDKYKDLNPVKIINKIAQKKYPLIPCRSKSGGLHLFIFLKEAAPAQTVKNLLSSMAASLGFAGCEVFPKQGKVLVERGDIGNWINMPYFDVSRTNRYGYGNDGSPLPIEDFLLSAEQSRFNVSDIKIEDNSLGDFTDGPPCLQNLLSSEIGAGMRNEVLVNIAKYLKKALSESWRTRLEEINEKHLKPPLPKTEVSTITRSVGNRDYFYSCNKPPLKPYCDRGACKLRKYGIGGESDFPMLTGLTKYDTVPPIWFVDVDDGGRIELTTEDLQNQIRFQRRCMDCLNLMPSSIKADQWRTVIQTLLEKVNIILVPRDASISGQLLDLLEMFCISKAQARVKEEIILGKPWTDKGRHYFKMANFLSYLERHHFREMKVHKIAQLIKDHGGDHVFMNLRGKGINLWSVPEFKKHDEESLEMPDMESPSDKI